MKGWCRVVSSCLQGGGAHTTSALHCTQEVGAEVFRERRRVMPSLSPGWPVVHHGRGPDNTNTAKYPGCSPARMTFLENRIFLNLFIIIDTNLRLICYGKVLMAGTFRNGKIL